MRWQDVPHVWRKIRHVCKISVEKLEEEDFRN
jgi:hypothetical protein